MLASVDEADRVIGTVRRADVFRLKANFRVAHLFLFNRRGQLLLQRLQSRRKRHPECWGSSVATYVIAGEDYKEAIVRRTREELGINLQEFESAGSTWMMDEGCKKFIRVFSGHSDGPFSVDHDHISEVRFASVDEIVQAKQLMPWTFTPTFAKLLDLYLNQRV